MPNEHIWKVEMCYLEVSWEILDLCLKSILIANPPENGLFQLRNLKTESTENTSHQDVNKKSAAYNGLRNTLLKKEKLWII